MNDSNQNSNGIHAKVVFATTKPISGSIDFKSYDIPPPNTKTFTLTGKIGPSVPLDSIEIIPTNAASLVTVPETGIMYDPTYIAEQANKPQYMNINEIDFDGIALADQAAHIADIEHLLGVTVVYPIGPEGS